MGLFQTLTWYLWHFTILHLPNSLYLIVSLCCSAPKYRYNVCKLTLLTSLPIPGVFTFSGPLNRTFYLHWIDFSLLENSYSCANTQNNVTSSRTFLFKKYMFMIYQVPSIVQAKVCFWKNSLNCKGKWRWVKRNTIFSPLLNVFLWGT